MDCGIEPGAARTTGRMLGKSIKNHAIDNFVAAIIDTVADSVDNSLSYMGEVINLLSGTKIVYK